MSLSNYAINRQVYGNPSAGVSVWSATHIQSATPVIIKEQWQSDIEGANTAIREATIQAKLTHPGICKIHECFLSQDSASGFRVYIVIEEMQGDLHSEIQRRRGNAEYWEEGQLLTYMQWLCETAAFAHSQGVAHRDIKPQNIFVGKNGELKFGDFGSARDTLSFLKSAQTRTLQGSPFYLSPELKRAFLLTLTTVDFNMENYDPFKSDVYSLGVTFLEMALLSPPRELLNIEQLETSTEAVLQSISAYPYVQYAVGCMLAISPESRVSFSDVALYIANLSQPAAPNTIAESGGGWRKLCMMCQRQIVDYSWQKYAGEEMRTMEHCWSDLCSVECLQRLCSMDQMTGSSYSAAQEPVDLRFRDPKYKEKCICLYCFSSNKSNVSIAFTCGHGFDSRPCLARFINKYYLSRHRGLPTNCVICFTPICREELIQHFGSEKIMRDMLLAMESSPECPQCWRTFDYQSSSVSKVCIACTRESMLQTG